MRNTHNILHTHKYFPDTDTGFAEARFLLQKHKNLACLKKRKRKKVNWKKGKIELFLWNYIVELKKSTRMKSLN